MTSTSTWGAKSEEKGEPKSGIEPTFCFPAWCLTTESNQLTRQNFGPLTVLVPGEAVAQFLTLQLHVQTDRNQHLWLQGILMNLGWICVIKTAHRTKVTWILESWPWSASDCTRKQYWNRSMWLLCSYLKMKKGKRKTVFHKLTISQLQIIVCWLLSYSPILCLWLSPKLSTSKKLNTCNNHK